VPVRKSEEIGSWPFSIARNGVLVYHAGGP
jgi:hypothetical protein